MFTNLIFLVLEIFTNNNSDRTPPYIDTYLQLIISKLWKLIMEKTLFDQNEPYYAPP